MPQYRNPFEKGDLYMKFDVQFPENNWINPDKLSELEDLLPSRPEVPNIIGDTEEVELQEFDSTQGSGGGQRCDAYNDIALMKKAVAIMDQECSVPISKLQTDCTGGFSFHIGLVCFLQSSWRVWSAQMN